MKAYAVIGANFGDEGKGLITDYLCRKHKANYVVRYNGGAQAGHTVVTPEGKRHVFSHFGSGTLAGVPTILSKYFIVNPALFRKEYELLSSNGVEPIVFVDPRCSVSTPFDMLINQLREKAHGAKANGSCGVGINDTINRNLYGEELTVSGVQDMDDQERYQFVNYTAEFQLGRIRKEKGVFISLEDERLFRSDGIIKRYLDDLDFFFDHATTFSPSRFSENTVLVFEGAQGLGLDEYMGTFPYVTRSNCGLRNIIDLQRSWGFDLQEVVYVTRSYLTRHGNGPMDFYDPSLSYEDNTNTPNQYQGTIRFGKLSVDDLITRTKTDMLSVNLLVKVRTSIAVTHLDQQDLSGDQKAQLHRDYESYGPTFKDVMER